MMKECLIALAIVLLSGCVVLPSDETTDKWAGFWVAFSKERAANNSNNYNYSKVGACSEYDEFMQSLSPVDRFFLEDNGGIPDGGTRNSDGSQVYLPGDNKVYSADECIGAVVNGVCHGSVIDTMPNRPICHGTMIGGQCTGPTF